jgi:NADH-quinone oxidoreductase subunit G
MAKITIDHKEHEFEDGLSIIEACHQVGIQIPHFCYHPKLEIAGNCRMCLVEVEGSRKPVPSCATPVQNGMVVHTTSETVKKDRQGVMEFLLINHPLDCPICDQAGECDLQDEALHYKDLGPLISTVMTRCIHCTRCIRFSEDIAGVEALGATGRGEHMEITTYLEEAIHSEISGNLIDICPVGALNSKPYKFNGRPWELLHTESIDVMDALGSHIRIDSRGGQVLRVKPRAMESINEEWLSDKARFSYDGLLYQRLDAPYIRNSKNILQKSTWKEAFDQVIRRSKMVDGSKIGVLAGGLADVETMFLFKKLMRLLGSDNIDCRTDGAYADSEQPASYVFNSTLEGVEASDVCLLIGTNPRVEAPLLNVRLRRMVMSGKTNILNIGPESSLTYPVQNLGNDLRVLQDIFSEKNPIFEVLKSANKPSIIIGQSALASSQGEEVLSLVYDLMKKYPNFLQENWNGFNVLHHSASRVGGLDVGFLPKNKKLSCSKILDATHSKSIEVLFLLGSDEVVDFISPDTFVIYIGHHGGAGAQRANVILPGAAYTEKDAIYVNTEGRVQKTTQAFAPPGEAKEDWKIVSELLTLFQYSETSMTLEGIRLQLAQEIELFKKIDELPQRCWNTVKDSFSGTIKSEVLKHSIDNYYMTDIISQNSKTMAECTLQFRKKVCK